MYSSSRLSILNTTLQRKETLDSLSVHSMCKLIRDESVKNQLLRNSWGLWWWNRLTDCAWECNRLFSTDTWKWPVGKQGSPVLAPLTRSPWGGREAVVSHTLWLTSCHSGVASKTHLNPSKEGNYSHMPCQKIQHWQLKISVFLNA